MTTNQQIPHSQHSILNFFYTNLDTIARIQDGHKLYINPDNTINIEEPYMFQGIWRYCYNVSRKDALHVLTKLFNDIEIYFNAIYVRNLECCNITNTRMNTNTNIIRFSETHTKAFNTIISKLQYAACGIANLKKTYSSDTLTCDELDKIIEKVQGLRINFEKLL